jgi:hypothetical protein
VKVDVLILYKCNVSIVVVAVAVATVKVAHLLRIEVQYRALLLKHQLPAGRG